MEEQSNADYVYRGATTRLEGRGVRTVEVDASVTFIEDSVYEYKFGKYSGNFHGWVDLQYIKIPNTVTRIGRGAFFGCRSLTSVTLPPSVTSIAGNAFTLCTSLTSVMLPPSLTHIGGGAFYECTSLTSVTLPSSITSIGNGFFYNCTALTSVTLPPSITSIGHGAFQLCTSLTTVTLPPSVTTIDIRVFDGCTSLSSVSLPPSITAIGNDVFRGCTSLVSLSLPPLVTNITTESSPDWFKDFLMEAGFSREDPDDILSGQPTLDEDSDSCDDPDDGDMYYEWKTWARTIGPDSQLPLFTAARKSLKWYYTKQIFTANMPVIYEIDALSGLPLSLLAAVGPTSDIESVYNLLKAFPVAISVNKSQSIKHISTHITRKRKSGKAFNAKL